MELKKEWKPLLGILALFAAAYWLPLGDAAVRQRAARGARAGEVVRAGARAAVPGAGVLHRGRDRRVREPGLGDEVPGPEGEQGRWPTAWPRSPARSSRSARARCCRCSPASTAWAPGSDRRRPSCTPVRPSTCWPSSFTARILGLEMGIARAVGAIVFSVVIGLLMHLIFRKEEQAKAAAWADMPEPEVETPALAERRVLRRDGRHPGVRELGSARTRRPAPGTRSGRRSGRSPSVAAAGLGAVLVAWFGMAWWKVAGRGRADAPSSPCSSRRCRSSPSASAVLGLSVVLATDKGEGETWFDDVLGLREADPAAAAHRGVLSRASSSAGPARRG